MSAKSVESYRAECPICGKLGVPWSVVTAGGRAVTINLRCACGHHWSATRVTDEHPGAPSSVREGGRMLGNDVLELGRKLDRRNVAR